MTENVNINAQVEPRDIPSPYLGQDWDELLQGAHIVQGSDQEKGNALIGVPFVLVQITVQPGDFRHGVFKDGKLVPDTGCGAEHPYAYLNAIIGPPATWEKARKRGRFDDETAELLTPGDSIGFIEAGTGVYREALHYLEDQQRLILPHPDGPDGGPFGNSRFDTSGDYIGEWVCDGATPEVYFESNPTGNRRIGQAIFRYTWNVRLVCPRGLRVSEYQNDYTKEGRTRYFA